MRRHRRYVDGREREADQVLCEHVGQLDVYKIEELLRGREDALRPPLQVNFSYGDSSLQSAPQYHLMISVLSQPIAHRVDVVSERAHAHHTRDCGCPHAEDRAQQFDFVERVCSVSDWPTERCHSD